jgi:hypothetical protein
MKSTFSKTIVISASILTIICAGCASSGNNFDESKTSMIRKGETTEADLINMFGSPINRMVDSEGATTLSWMYGETHVKAISFVPLAGAIAGGSSGSSKTLSVSLVDGKVKNYTMTDGGGQSRMLPQSVPKN